MRITRPTEDIREFATRVAALEEAEVALLRGKTPIMKIIGRKIMLSQTVNF